MSFLPPSPISALFPLSPSLKPPPAAQVPGSEDELPPWVRREKERELQAKDGVSGLPWGLCLLFSVFTAIAAVGSIFEFVDRNAIFGVIQPDSPLWAPILLFFGVTGFPTAGKRGRGGAGPEGRPRVWQGGPRGRAVREGREGGPRGRAVREGLAMNDSGSSCRTDHPSTYRITARGTCQPCS